MVRLKLQLKKRSQKQINDLIDVFPNYDLDEVINSNDDEVNVEATIDLPLR